MNSDSNTHRTFHPIIAKAYTKVHQWLDNLEQAKGYKTIEPRGKWKEILQQEDLKHIAFQYYHLFPSHYFKAAHSLEYIITEEKLINWLRHNQKICVLDIGCGAGAGSAAFLEAVLYLKESGKLTKDVNLFFIGVDPSHLAIALYHKMMEYLKLSTNDLVNLDYKPVIKGFPDASIEIRQLLEKERASSRLPCFTNTLVMQLNVISPFSQNYRNEKAKIDELKNLGINIDEFVEENNIRLGTTEAQSYRQLIEDVPIDIMHILTVGTRNMENQVQIGTNSEVPLSERIQEMAHTLQLILGNKHKINQNHSDHHAIYFENPEGSYWKDKGRAKIGKPVEFYADFQTIWSADLEGDSHWNDVISLDNLSLAWARARYNFLRETLCDETEMRLFEMNLEVRLDELREKLCAYAREVALTDESIHYKVPKNINDTRPKGLSRIEEEILSVAIIQQLGNKASQLRGNSYAYKIAGDYRGRQTEYFYGYWFDAYQAYMTQAKDSAKKYPNCGIMRVDIESFYTKIIQSQLCDELCYELTESERIRWLIRLLLSKNIDEHEVGRGITQGSIGSGFYANIYLTAIDTRFGLNREPKAELHRYVDDMIFIVPDPEDVDEVEKILVEELTKLGLKLNQKKTEKLTPQEFLQQAEDEEQCLEKLSKDFDCIVNYLYILNPEHRSLLEKSYDDDERWWHNIEQYQQCLRAINIYIQPTELSRKIYKYLFNQKRREKDLKQQLEILNLEGETKKSLPSDDNSFSEIMTWAANFTYSNNIWNQKQKQLRNELVELFCDSWQKLCELNNNHPNEQRKLQRYIRFTLFRLSILGFEEIVTPLMEILCGEKFWIIRYPIHILESLARQGYCAQIRTLLNYYTNRDSSSEYLKAITLRALRFLPNIDGQEWEIIVEFSTLESSSIVEKLMATETWLYLGHKYSSFKQDSHLQSVKKALNSEQDYPKQLVKNYILILGLFGTNIVQNFTKNVNNDPMLKDARNLALKGSPSDIFDFPELNILRHKYYSGQPQYDNQEGSP
jgi:SAM-dependent methyltransferase